MGHKPRKIYQVQRPKKKYKKVQTIRKEYHQLHEKEFKKYEAVRNTELRELAMEALGGVCAHCGNADPRVLQIDHVFARGSRERKEIGTRGILIKILESAGYGYQILCSNCNCIKRIENNENRPYD